jgi:hypothetical protein
MNIVEAMQEHSVLELASYLGEHKRYMYWNGCDWIVRDEHELTTLYSGPSEEKAVHILLED